MQNVAYGGLCEGPQAVRHRAKTTIDLIMASAAYKANGVIFLTSDEPTMMTDFLK